MGSRRRVGAGEAGAVGARDEAEEVSLVDAVDDLPPADWTDPSGRALTPVGRERLLHLQQMLREMRLLLLEEGHCFRDQALSFCNMQSSPPREVLDASSLSTLVQMVGAGIGVTLIPEMAVTVETRSAPVTVSRFKHPQIGRAHV